MKKEFIVNRQGKDFVLYAGLLDQAHREGLKRIATRLIQAPTEENGHLAICHAEVETEKGIFSGIGDASPQNVGRMIAMHSVRMAETRAKARALRDAINVGVTAFEELGDFEEVDSPAAVTLVQRSVDQRRPGRAPVEQPGESLGERGKIALVRESAGTRGEGTAPASADQIARLVKLQSSLGRPAEVPADLTAEEAVHQITELVHIFNTQVRAARSRQLP